MYYYYIPRTQFSDNMAALFTGAINGKEFILESLPKTAQKSEMSNIVIEEVVALLGNNINFEGQLCY